MARSDDSDCDHKFDGDRCVHCGQYVSIEAANKARAALIAEIKAELEAEKKSTGEG